MHVKTAAGRRGVAPPPLSTAANARQGVNVPLVRAFRRSCLVPAVSLHPCAATRLRVAVRQLRGPAPPHRPGFSGNLMLRVPHAVVQRNGSRFEPVLLSFRRFAGVGGARTCPRS